MALPMIGKSIRPLGTLTMTVYEEEAEIGTAAIDREVNDLLHYLSLQDPKPLTFVERPSPDYAIVGIADDAVEFKMRNDTVAVTFIGRQPPAYLQNAIKAMGYDAPTTQVSIPLEAMITLL